MEKKPKPSCKQILPCWVDGCRILNILDYKRCQICGCVMCAKCAGAGYVCSACEVILACEEKNHGFIDLLKQPE